MPRYAETLGIRRTSQSNDRQVLPTPMMAHIKANASATVAGDRCVRRCAWPHEYFDPTGYLIRSLEEFVSNLVYIIPFGGSSANSTYESDPSMFEGKIAMHLLFALVDWYKTPSKPASITRRPKT